MQAKDEKFLPTPKETKILLFPSRILDLVICEIVPFHI
jgi:hypothetical protein